MMILLAFMSIVSMVGIPIYVRAVEVAQEDTAVQDMKTIASAIELHYLQHGSYPKSLQVLALDHLRDPWGAPYIYLPLQRLADKSKAQSNNAPMVQVKSRSSRKDNNLVPINTDFDLSSRGPDGQSAASLKASISRDDIVRGRNGDYIGLAATF